MTFWFPKEAGRSVMAMPRGAGPLYSATWTESGVTAHGECEDVALVVLLSGQNWRPWGFYPISCTNSHFAVPRRALGASSSRLFTQNTQFHGF